MKKNFLLFLAVMFFIVSCSEDSNDDTTPKGSAIKFTSEGNTPQTFGENGGNTTVAFTAHKAWAISAKDSRAIDKWYTIEPMKGDAGNATISITIKANDTYEQRSTTITIICGEDSETIEVKQSQKGVIIIADKEYEFDHNGGKLDFDVNTSVDLDINVSDNAKSWIKQVSTRALETKSLHFDIANSTQSENREGIITISGAGITQDIIIKQKGNEILEKERAALITFYHATNGSNWKDSYGTIVNENWCSDKPVGEWYGIKTNNLGYVTDITFVLGNLTGYIPVEIGNLESLKNLRLISNPELTGEIPKEIGKCKELEFFMVEETAITGTIPKELFDCQKLKVIALTDNRQLTGNIPPEIGKLQKLVTIGMARTGIAGEIPAEIGNLANIEALYLSGNGFTGSIPQTIDGCKNLKWLDLAGNQLSGPLPTTLGNCENLIYVDLQGNRLEGDIPTSVIQNDKLWEHSWGSILYGNLFNTDNIVIPAPGFKVKDINGNTVDSKAEYAKNKLTIIYQWATWCPVSNEVTSNINNLYKRYKDSGLDIIGLCSEAEDTARNFIKNNNITWRNILNHGDNAIKKGISLHNIYSSDFSLSESGLSAYPTVVYPSITMIDQKGDVVYSDVISDFYTYSHFIDKYFTNNN